LTGTYGCGVAYIADFKRSGLTAVGGSGLGGSAAGGTLEVADLAGGAVFDLGFGCTGDVTIFQRVAVATIFTRGAGGGSRWWLASCWATSTGGGYDAFAPTQVFIGRRAVRGGCEGGGRSWGGFEFATYACLTGADSSVSITAVTGGGTFLT